MKTLYVVAIVVAIATAAVAFGVGLEAQSVSRLKNRLAAKGQTKADTAETVTTTHTVQTDTNMNAHSELGHENENENENEAEADTGSEVETENEAVEHTETETETEAESEFESEAEAESDADEEDSTEEASLRLLSVRSQNRQQFESFGSADAGANCGPTPRPPYCTLVNWPVEQTIIDDNTKNAADMILAMELVNFKGSRFCAAWLTNLRCRSLWPDCSKSEGPRPCKSECLKFVSNCHGDESSCNVFATSNCYTGGISAAPTRFASSPLIWLLLALTTVVLARWSL